MIAKVTLVETFSLTTILLFHQLGTHHSYKQEPVVHVHN